MNAGRSRGRMAGIGVRVVVAALACAAFATATRADDFLDGQTLRILIGGYGGGSYDETARLVAQGLGERLPRTRVVAENSPKAGGRVMANEIAAAEPTGTTIGFVPTGLIYAQILGEPGIAFDLAKLEWIVSVNPQRRLLVVSRQSGVTSFADLVARKAPLNLPSRSTSSASYYDPLLLNAMLGTKLRPVPGYSSGGRSTALLGGEVEGIVASYDAVEAVIASGAAIPVLRLSRRAPLPALRDVPSLVRFATDPASAQILELIEINDDFGRFIATTPRTPPERVERLRALTNEVLADPKFLAAARRMGVEIAPTDGATVAERVRRLLGGASADVTQRLRAALECGSRRAGGDERC